jgi:hypothetical protein
MVKAIEFGRCYKVPMTTSQVDQLTNDPGFWDDLTISKAWDLDFLLSNVLFFNAKVDDLEAIMGRIQHYLDNPIESRE